MRAAAMVFLMGVLVGCSGLREQVGEVGQSLWGEELVAQGRGDFPGVVPEGPGKWEVEGWVVEAARAWVERRGGVVVRLYAEGDFEAARGGIRARGTWVSIGPGGVPVVAECRQVMAEGKHYHSGDGLVRLEYRGEGRLRVLGAVVTR